jgi:adenine phosphoribosyltransferase
MGEEASCNAASAMEAATNARPAKENGRAPAVAEVVAQEAAADPRLQGISDAIRVVPHFPKHGTTPFFTHSLTPLHTPSAANCAARQ